MIENDVYKPQFIVSLHFPQNLKLKFPQNLFLCFTSKAGYKNQLKMEIPLGMLFVVRLDLFVMSFHIIPQSSSFGH